MTAQQKFQKFGRPDQFEIATRWSGDAESRENLPRDEGWSTGELCIKVCGTTLTQHRYQGQTEECLSWYLSPLVDWLMRHWTWLLHEERYAWPDKTGLPAAPATAAALERNMAALDEVGRQTYASTHAWWSRHALRAADSSALLPDIYFRRAGDDIEVSWLSRQPDFAPDGFSLNLAPGYALLPVASVAETLWAFLDWATQTAPASNEADHALVAGLRARFSALRNTPITVLEQASIGEKVQSLLTQARLHAGLADDAVVADEQPAIVFLDSAVLMFGGLNVDLNSADVNSLVGFLAQCKGTQESPAVAALVEQPDRNAWSHAYEEGYRLAEDLRERLGIDADQLYVDIDQILAQLGVAVVERALATPGIRGVAVAGAAFTPSILINTSSFYNKNAAGKRFTLAHELCHILYDRTRARKISHVSGPWSSARTEKRANAFAAMLLASPSAIRKNLDLDALTSPAVTQLAQSLGIGFTALVEHLYNVDLINDCERDQLRPAH